MPSVCIHHVISQMELCFVSHNLSKTKSKIATIITIWFVETEITTTILEELKDGSIEEQDIKTTPFVPLK